MGDHSDTRWMVDGLKVFKLWLTKATLDNSVETDGVVMVTGRHQYDKE